MHIKKFEGKDLKEALARIREELGPEAVILETAPHPRPRRGVTVLAALPREAGDVRAAEPAFAAAASPVDGPAGRGAFRRPLPSRLETADTGGPIFGSTNLGGVPLRPLIPSARDGVEPALSPASWRSESAPAFPSAPLRSVTVPAFPLAPRRSATAPAFLPTLPPSEATVPFPRVATSRAAEVEEETRVLRARVEHLNRLVRSDHFSAVPLPLRQLYFDLTDAEVDADLVFRILEKMGSAPIPGQFTSSPPGDLLAYLGSLVRTGGALQPGERRVLALVGPTGVGKTTTLAKIAGQACFHRGLSVALVSSDSYRVFGAQHLAAYAALMGLPFFAVASVAAMRTLLSKRLADVDLVLIDTSGRSPNDPGGITEIRQLLAACPTLDVHLALSANTRARDLAHALDAFSVLPVRHLVFTKLDEATSRGGMYTTALKARCPVSWLGTGQEVPDDLEAATAEALTHGLLEEASHGGSGR
jgi:flagellar biosynthesis protein FlhF